MERHLGKPFARPHDVGRAHSFVSANQDEISNSIFSRSLRRMQRAEHVILDALRRVVFDQRHMLVGGSVVNRIRMPCRDNLTHAFLVFDRGQQRH